MRTRAGAKWKPRMLAAAALLWACSDSANLKDRFAQARKIVGRVFRWQLPPGQTYQGFMKMLHKRHVELILAIEPHVRLKMREVMPGQWEIACGRRWGKTTLALISCVHGHGLDRLWRGAVDGGHILWVAPTYSLSNEVWRFLKKPTELAWAEKSEVERRIELPGGGAISVRSADDPDSLCGVGCDGMVLDEAAFCREEAWSEAIRPAFADRQGWGILVSTPKGLNWFHRLFREAKSQPNWERWQQPTTANPLIPAEEAEDSRRQLGAHSYTQEFLAQFVTPGGSRIQSEWFRYYRRLKRSNFQAQTLQFPSK